MTSDPRAEPGADPRAASLAGRIAVAIAAISARSEAIAAAAPLATDARLGHDEDAWGPREVLAHVAEAVPFWHGELERILAGDAAAGPTPFGRTPDDTARAGIIARDRTLPAFVLIDRLGRDGAAITARVRRLTPTQLDHVGRHPAWGDLPLHAVLERTLAGHLEGHVRQLDELLG
jgi:hypothetical protein